MSNIQKIQSLMRTFGKISLGIDHRNDDNDRCFILILVSEILKTEEGNNEFDEARKWIEEQKLVLIDSYSAKIEDLNYFQEAVRSL